MLIFLFLFLIFWIIGRFSIDLPETVDLFITTESLLCVMLLSLWLHYNNRKAVDT